MCKPKKLSPPFTAVLVCAHGWLVLPLDLAFEPLKRLDRSPGTDFVEGDEMMNFETDAPAYASFPGSSGTAPGPQDCSAHDRNAIDAAVAQVFGLCPQHMKSATRGRAPAALAR